MDRNMDNFVYKYIYMVRMQGDFVKCIQKNKQKSIYIHFIITSKDKIPHWFVNQPNVFYNYYVLKISYILLSNYKFKEVLFFMCSGKIKMRLHNI